MTRDTTPDELRELLEKASPTPWTMGKHEQVRSPDGRQVSVWGAGIAWASRDQETESNGKLLIEAVNALPALLDAQAEAERLRGENEHLEKIVAARNASLDEEIALTGKFTARFIEAQARADRLEGALRGLFPDDFDEHPEDYSPEWHAARSALSPTQREGN